MTGQAGRIASTRRCARQRESNPRARPQAQIRSVVGAPVQRASFGSIRVDHNSRSATSFSVTVITSVTPSMAMCPKNCNPKQGARFSPCSALHPLWKIAVGAERVVQVTRPPASGVDRTGYELPDRLEVLKYRAIWIVVMRCGVVHVGGDPRRVAHTGMFDEGEDVRDLKLAAKRRTVPLRGSILADQPDRSRSAAITFQVAIDAIKRCLSHSVCAAPRTWLAGQPASSESRPVASRCRHRASAVESRRNLPGLFGSGSTLLRLLCDSFSSWIGAGHRRRPPRQ